MTQDLRARVAAIRALAKPKQDILKVLADLVWHDVALDTNPACADQVRDNGWKWPFYEPLLLDDPLKAAIKLLQESTAR